MAATTAAVITAGAAVGGAAMDNKNAKASVKSAEAQRAASLKFINDQVAKTQGQLFQLFPQVQDANNQAMNAGLDVLKASYPAQQDAFVAGNVGAQKALIAGLPQMNNAILGGPINNNAFSPVQVASPVAALANPKALQFAPMVSPDLLAASK